MNQVQSQDKFRFFLPVHIEKGKDGKIKEVIVEGKASSPDLDSQEEMLDPQGADLSSFLIINDNHIKGSAGILGEITESAAKKDGIYLKGRLYPELESVQKFVQLEDAIKKNNGRLRLAMSIEGRALERDGLDPRKIKRSKLTGVALTYQPVNGNTWANLITKGATYQDDEELQYDTIIEQPQPDVSKSHSANGGNPQYILDITDENGNRITVSKDFEIKIDKAMDTTSAAPLRKESLESDVIELEKQKKSKKNFFIKNKSDKFNQNLSKSEVYDYIFDNIDHVTIDSAKQLYTYIEYFQKSQNDTMAELTEEKLQKAFNTLEILSQQSTENLQKGGMPSLDQKTQGGAEQVLEKMASTMKSYMEKGMTKEDIFKAMKESDDYKDSKDEDMEKAYGMCGEVKKSEDVVNENKEGGGEIEKSEEVTENIDDEILKAEQSLADLKAKKEAQIKPQATIEKSQEITAPIVDFSGIETLIKGMQDQFNEKFSAIGEINKAILEQNEDLKNKLFKSEQEKQELENKSQGRKSIITKSFIEKGQEDELNKGTSLSVTQHKAQILSKADSMIDWNSDDIRKGYGNEFAFANEIATYESTGQVGQGMINKFKEKGITLVQ